MDRINLVRDKYWVFLPSGALADVGDEAVAVTNVGEHVFNRGVEGLVVVVVLDSYSV